MAYDMQPCTCFNAWPTDTGHKPECPRGIEVRASVKRLEKFTVPPRGHREGGVMEWENVSLDARGALDQTQRMKVPGGWIYRSMTSGVSHGLVFVPDPETPRPIRLPASCGKHTVPSPGFGKDGEPPSLRGTPCPLCGPLEGASIVKEKP